MREGSARVFFQSSSPGTLPVADRLGSTSLIGADGYMFVDSDDNALYIYDGGTGWEEIGIGHKSIDDLGDVNLTAPAGGTLLRYDGADWVDQNPAVGDIATANITSAVSLAATTPTAINIGTNPAVTVPNDGGTYNIHVHVFGSLCSDTNSQSFGLEIVQDPAGTPAVVAAIGGIIDSAEAFPFSMHYLIEGATNNTTYTFGLQGAATAATNVFLPPTNANCSGVTDALTSGSPNVRMTVTLDARGGIQ